MANLATYQTAKRAYCARIGAYTEGYGVKVDGKWSNTRTVNIVVPYTETTTLTVAKADSASPIDAATSTMAQFVVPANTLTGSTEGVTVDYESASTTRNLGRVSECGFYDLTEISMTAGTPTLQIPGVTPLAGYTPTANDILIADRTYNQAIGSVKVGYGFYDEKAGTWSNYRNATIVGKFRERSWERRALRQLTTDTPSLFFDTYYFLWGLVGRQNVAAFDYEYRKVESSCVLSAPCGFYTKTTLFKETIGISVV